MAKDRILVTGGAGFIGRALVAHCVQQGHEVTVLDNLCAGRSEHLEPFKDAISFHNADVTDSRATRELCTAIRPERVIHLAAHHFIPFCDANPDATLRVNVEGTLNVLREAARQETHQAVVASSGALYPSQDDLLSEDIAPAPADIYGLSKHMTEEVARFVAESTGMPCVAARLFNTYGPYETNPHLIPHIVESLRTAPHVSLGNTWTKRDYIYVDDVARVLYDCAYTQAEGLMTVNVGTGAEYSAAEIVTTLSQLLGTKIEVRVDSKRVRQVDKLHQRADTRRLQQVTSLPALHSITEGLRKLLVHEGLIAGEGESVAL